MLTHLECNPQMLGQISNQGGLRFHEWKVQMGLPQGDLLSLQKSIEAPQNSHSRRVLSGMRLQPQVRYSTAQRSSTAKNQDHNPQGSSPHLRGESHLVFDSGLGSRGLSLLGATQSSATVVAAVGHQALDHLGPSPKAAAYDQPLYHRPPTQVQKAPTENQALRAHQARHFAQTSYPHQNRLLGCQNARLYRNRFGLSLRQLCFGGVPALAQCHRHSFHLGGNSCGDGQKPDRGTQSYARN